MKKLKNIASILMAVVLLIAVIPLGTISAGAETSGIFQYEVVDGEATITMCDYQAVGDITIPSIINGYPVTSISGSGFSGFTGLTSITIPDSVTSIGGYAFSDCTGLTSITIPGSVTSIGDFAFSGCTGFTSITIPDSVTSIGWYAFSRCTGLTSVTIGNSVTSISGNAFYGCTSLTSITIPDSVTSIGQMAFSGCTSLTSVTILDGVEVIDFGAFNGCTNLKNIKIPDSVKNVGSIAFSDTEWYNSQPDGIVYAGKVAYDYKGDTNGSVVIKDGTYSIAEYCFGNKNLTSVTIPNSLKEIKAEAFSGCTKLSEIRYSGTQDDWQSINIGANNENLALPYVILKRLDVIKEADHVSDGKLYNDGINHWQICQNCSEIFDVEKHIYDNEQDSICNVCGYKRTIAPAFNENEMYAKVSCSEGKAGKEVTVNISIENAEEITAIGVSDIAYDTTALTLKDAKWLCEDAKLSSWDKENNLCVTVFENAKKPEGNVLSLTFKVNDEAKLGDYDVSVYFYTTKNKVNTRIAVLPGTVTVKDYIKGDLNGDDIVNTDDATYLLFHTFFQDFYPVHQNCDFDNDGMVSDRDVIRLLFFVFFPEFYDLG